MENWTLLTGACGGLGKAYSREVLKAGNLFITGTSLEKLAKEADSLKALFPERKIEFALLNLAEVESINALIDCILSKKINITRLINCAGNIKEGGALDLGEKVVGDVIKVNSLGTVTLTMKMLSSFDIKEILTVSSLGAFYPMPYMSVYSSTKRMLESFMVALRVELFEKNIKVSTVCPGGIPTTDAMKDAIKSQGLSGKLSSKSPEYIAKYSLKKLQKNKAIIIPGAFNRFLYFIGRFGGEEFTAKMLGKRWKNAEKKRKRAKNAKNNNCEVNK